MTRQRELENRLAELCGRRFCILTGRAASALYLAFRSLPAGGRRIVLPAILCPAPANAALYAGFEPLFCDVSMTDANLSVTDLEKLLAEHDDIAGIMPAHLYGHPANMTSIEALARRHEVPVIEDAAQAFGGTHEGRPLGSFGDMSVISFGHTKIIDIGHGGAVLTNDETLAMRLREAATALPAPAPAHDAMALDARATYYRLKAKADQEPRLNALFLPLPEIYRDLYLIGFDPTRTEDLMHALDGLETAVDARRRKAAIYREALADADGMFLEPRPGGVPWRFSFLLPEGQQSNVTDGLRAADFDASNWYPALPKWYEAGRRQESETFANADQIEHRILNLWLDSATDEHRIEANCRVLTELLCGANGTIHGLEADRETGTAR